MQDTFLAAQQYIGIGALKAHPGAEAAQVADHKGSASPFKADVEPGYPWVIDADGGIGGTAAVHRHIVGHQRAFTVFPLQMDLAQDGLLRIFQFRQ